jgi:hypothetical protein
METESPRKLPPLSAIEFAIEQTFRNFGFSLLLVIAWIIVLLPLFAAGYALGVQAGTAKPAELPAAGMAVAALLGIAIALCLLSVSVNWHRRILLAETPRRWAWLRLDGPVWRFLGYLLVIAVWLAIVGGLAVLVLTRLTPEAMPQLGPMAKPLSIALAVVLVLIGLLVADRLSTSLAAVAVANRSFGIGQSLRVTRRHTWRLLGMTFWMLFTLAIAGSIAAGGYLLHQQLGTPWTLGLAILLGALVTWFSVFFVLTLPASVYRHLGEGREFEQG